MTMPKINPKDPKVIIGAIAIIVIAYVLYKRHQASTSSITAGTATTPGQDAGIPLTDPNATDPSGSTGSGGGGSGPGPDLSGYETQSGESSDIAGINSQLTGIESAIPGDITAALAAAGYVPPTSTSGGATGGGTSPFTGPLNAFPEAVQIAIVRSELASPTQLGPNAAKAYAAGKSGAPQRISKQQERQINAAVGQALHRQQQAERAKGHSTHAAGNAAHGSRSHAVAAPKPTPRPPASHPRKPVAPRPAQRRPGKH